MDGVSEDVLEMFRKQFTPMPREVSERLAATSSPTEVETILLAWIDEGCTRIDLKIDSLFTPKTEVNGQQN